MIEAATTTESLARRGRWLVLAAAVMWSSSGLFAKSHAFDAWPPESRGLTLAFWRALFAGMTLLPLVRRPAWRGLMLPMALAFGAMNGAYLTSMALSTAANAIWLQSTSPLWVFLLGVSFLRERGTRRDLEMLAIGLAGVGLIVGFELAANPPLGTLSGLASGVLYACVVVSLRYLRDVDSAWLVVVNHLVAAAVLAPIAVYLALWPTPWQFAILACFGCLQMAVPYWLFSRGLRYVSSHEAAGIGLVEPLLVPVWAFIARREVPAWWTIAGGALILVGLVWRYARVAPDPRATAPEIEPAA